MSLPPEIDVEADTLRPAASELLEREVITVERIGGGRNSRVFRLEDARSNRFALKIYFRDGNDARDRLGTEFSALSFLWESGLRQVPRPIAADSKRGYAIYEFIEGVRFADQKINLVDLEAAIGLVGSLKELCTRSESQRFGPASEACFSVEAISVQLGQRRQRLSSAEGTASSLNALNDFLSGRFSPALDQFVQWSQARLRSAGIDPEKELTWPERTLSPSDFGFHNALRRADGQIIFLDFEYFGWDDPAKLIADFLLHPAMDLTADIKRHFMTNAIRCFPGNQSLAGRVEAVYPLFGLKWCLILLNEFLPADLQRRRFAQRAELDRDQLQMKQLEKAKQMLSLLCHDYERFPRFE
jgi:hypothetical protein